MKGAACLAAIAALWLWPAPGRATPAPDACIAATNASLAAITRGDYTHAGEDFSAALAADLTAVKLGETWREIQAMAGAYRSHGAARRQPLRGQPAVVVPVAFAQHALDFVTACDAANRITAFYLLKPSAVVAASAIAPHTQPDGVRVLPLAVPSPDGPLRGALTLPAGNGPFAAVVMVAGSGPADMDESEGPNRPFRDLADGLAKAGIASLRYDKRTFDYPLAVGGDPAFTVDDEVTDDALAALHLLAQQPRIDPRRVFVLGHSLGAQMAPRIAARDRHVAGAILLAAPARSFLAMIAWQLRGLGPAQGMPAAALAQQERAIAAEQKLLAGASAAHPPAGTFAPIPGAPALSQAYLLSLQDIHQVATAQRLAVPLLILQGDNDFQVSPTLDFDAWKRALAGRPNVAFHRFPGLSHLFMPGPTKSPADYARPAHVAPAVIDTIAAWIKARPPHPPAGSG